MLADFINKLKHDISFRAKLLLLLSFILNLAYSVFLVIEGVTSHSKWFLITAIYYALLSIARIFLFIQTPTHIKLAIKVKTMLACGWYLLILNLAFGAMSFVLIHLNPLTKHGEIAVITLATYTFYSLTIAIINSVKYFKKNDPVHLSAKLLSLISASVSMVTLTNTMLTTFGGNGQVLRSYILPILSVAVSIFIVILAILMIKKASLDLRRLKDEQERR